MAKHIQILNDENFDDIIESGVTLVDFFADWCGPCRMLTPILEDVSQEMHKQVNFGKLDIDQSFKIAGTFQVTSVPTLILFKNGKEVGRLVGLRDAPTIKEFAKSAL